MADIKQAAKWMQEGNRIRRSAWRELNPALALNAIPAELIFKDIHDGVYGYQCDCIVNADMDHINMFFSTSALLADDWEIAE